MAVYVKGNPVTNATSYELLEKKDSELIDFAKASNIPAGWVYDAANNVYTMTNADYSNLRFNLTLEAGATYLFKYTFSELTGGAQATIRNAANTTLHTMMATKGADTYTQEFTPTESGEYSFRICGTGATCSGTLTEASVSIVGADVSYASLATAAAINFDVSALGLSAGKHTFVVKAKADGYEDSDYSNEVVYTAE